jgi:hypothetical protein
LNKKRRVLRAGGLEHEEASARRINAQPWEPLPGMVKRRCGRCRYWFAAKDVGADRCPDCEIRLRRAARQEGEL